MSYIYIILLYIILIILHYITLQYITLHYITLHYIILKYHLICGLSDAWLSGWLAEISADLRETVAH